MRRGEHAPLRSHALGFLTRGIHGPRIAHRRDQARTKRADSLLSTTATTPLNPPGTFVWPESLIPHATTWPSPVSAKLCGSPAAPYRRPWRRVGLRNAATFRQFLKIVPPGGRFAHAGSAPGLRGCLPEVSVGLVRMNPPSAGGRARGHLERIPPNSSFVLLTPESRKETAFLDHDPSSVAALRRVDLSLDLDRFPDCSRPGFM